MLRKYFLTIFIMASLVSIFAIGVNADTILDTLANLQINNNSNKKSSSEGIDASEILSGNGTRAGYVLGHTNVIENSESIFVGVKHAKKNLDYSIDYSSGSIYFVSPVNQFDNVRVDYKYNLNLTDGQNVAVPSAIPLRFGNSTSNMSLSFGYKVAGAPGNNFASDIMTYGVNSQTSLGSSSTLDSLLFISTPQETNRLTMNGNAFKNNKDTGIKAQKDRLNVQNADIGLGNIRVKLGMQDIGENFAGFSSMRESKSTATDVLNMLEKEKGIKRTGFGIDMAAGKSSGLNLATSSIKDKKGNISYMTAGYSSSNIKLNYKSREIDKLFNRFADLREVDKAQMAAEAGVKRNEIGFQFKSGTDNNKTDKWNSVSNTSLEDINGSLERKSADVEIGNLKIQVDTQDMSKGFNNMLALNDDERTRIAYISKSMFNPDSKPSDVSAQDKTDINNQAGLDRSNYIFQFGGKGLKTSILLSNIESAKGDLSRKSFIVEGKLLKFYYNQNSIDLGFNRIQSLQSIEKLHFANENGMTRTEMGASFTISKNDLQMNSSIVTDNQNAKLSRRAFKYKSDKYKFDANFLNIDPDFKRIEDISDTDKAILNKEKGFNRSDYHLNLQATKLLNIDSYVYTSSSSLAGQTRNQDKNSFVYATPQGMKITALMDDYDYSSEKGNLSTYSRRLLTYDNKFKLLGGTLLQIVNDTNTTQELSNDPIDAVTTLTHVESNINGGTSVSLNTTDITYGDTNVEKTNALGVKSKLNSKLALTSTYSTTERDNKKTENSAMFGFDWAINKELKMSLNASNRLNGPNGTQIDRKFQLNGLLSKRLLIFDNVMIGSAIDTSGLNGIQSRCNNSFKLQTGILGAKALIDNSDKRNEQNGIYYASRILNFETPASNKNIKMNYFRQDLKNPDGKPAKRRNYGLDLKLFSDTNLIYISKLGKDGQNGIVLPVGSTVFKLSSLLKAVGTVSIDYTVDVNNTALTSARTIGLGISGKMPQDILYELYYGFTEYKENEYQEHQNIYRIKFDKKIDSSHLVSFSAQKRSGVEKSLINPLEGRVVLRADYKSDFN